MTAVVSPSSYQSYSRSEWTNGNGNNHGHQMSLNPAMAEEVSRSGPVPRKSAQRSNSSSSLSSTGSTSSTSTNLSQTNGVQNGELTWGGRKKPTRGIWPSTKAEPVSGLTTARPQSVPPSPSGASAASAISALVPTQNTNPPQSQQGAGARGQGQPEGTSVLYLSPLNGTFERKTITVPCTPDILRIGRQTNQKTVPTPTNGYFDSKVLSRQHAEIWADKEGRIWIRDVKSSNGTFVNGTRLSPENRDSEPHLIKDQDHLELGIDIVSEDHKHIVHHKVSARVERAGPFGAGQEQQEVRTQEQPPQLGNGLPMQPQGQGARSRSSSQGQSNGQTHFVNPRGNMMGGASAYHAKWLQPVSMEQIVIRLNGELRQGRSQGHNLGHSERFVGAVVSDKALPPAPSQKLISPNRTFDLKTRFSSEPPAPPPQQPLPEKPDSHILRTKVKDLAGVQPLLRRSDTERPKLLNGLVNNKPAKHKESPQDPNLVEMLNSAKKEISTQGVRLRDMEEALQKEREARSLAEALVSRLESAKLIPGTNMALNSSIEIELNKAPESSSESAEESENVPARVQLKLDMMRAEMEGIRTQMERYRQRAETAEAESEKSRKTLMEMVKGIRKKEDAAATAAAAKASREQTRQQKANESTGHATGNVGDTDALALSDDEFVDVDNGEGLRSGSNLLPNGDAGVSGSNEKDGHKRVRRVSATHDGTMNDHGSRSKSTSSKDVVGLNSTTVLQPPQVTDEAITSVPSGALTTWRAPQEAIVQSAPYATMLGVVLLGVGMMAYMNGWQTIPRER